MNWPPYTGYRDSGIEWLGPIPAHWKTAPLWSMFRREKNTGFPKEQMLSVYREHGVVVKDSRDDNLNKTAEDRNIYQLVGPGWLVTNRMKAWQGSVGISNHQGIVSGHYICFKPEHDSVNAYLNYLFRSTRYVTGYQTLSRGVRPGQAEIDNDQYRTMPVVLPPNLEQSAIADFLDRETAKIDSLIAKQEQLIATLREDRTATITHAVTKGLDPEVEMKESGVEWLGKVPAHWSVDRIKRSVFSARNGIWGNEPDGGPNDIRCVRVADFDRPVLRIHDRDATFRNVSTSECNGRILRNGNLLLEKSGGGEKNPVGFVVHYDRDEPAVCSNFVARVELAQGEDPQYWTYVHHCLYASRLTYPSIKQNTGIQNLDQDSYFNERACYPPLEEQRKIVAYLDDRCRRMDSLIAKADAVINTIQEYRSALITDAVTGKIDVRGVA